MLRTQRTLHACMVLAIAIACSIALPSKASAERSGFTFGVGAGGGVLTGSCDGCGAEGSTAVSLHLGWMLTPRLALLYGGSASVVLDGFGGTVSTVLTGSIQYWVMPRLWLRGGVGVAELDVAEGAFGQQERGDRGLGLAATAGYELTELGRFPLELLFQAHVGFYEPEPLTGVSLLLGVSWY